MSGSRPRTAGLTLAEALVAIVIIGILAALFIPALSKSFRYEKVAACASNLRQLHKAQGAYSVRFPGRSDLGRAYWLRLTEVQPPLAGRSVLTCPLVGSGQGPCHYLGPASDPERLSDADPVGSDEPFNHSEDGRQGGNVLRKSGDVQTDNRQLWNDCVRGGRLRP